jgi:sigma-E factor negative regulatory protein RseA
MKADVSALMDDALEDPSQSSVLNTLCRDPQLRQAWSEYHLIGDVLRRSPRLSSDVTAQVMARLVDEPAVLAPRPAPRRRSAALRYALPLAASVMGVGAVAWVAQTLNGPETVQVAAVKPAAMPKPAPVAAAAANASEPVAGGPVVEEADPAKASQVKPYLFAHQSFSPVSGVHGVAQYVRIVSDTREGPAR